MSYEAATANAIAALADPTRRAIIDRLRTGPCPVTTIAADLPVSRPAVSQHLRVMTDAGLLKVEAQGTRRLYRISPEGVDALRAYLDTLWSDALQAFEEAGTDAGRKG